MGNSGTSGSASYTIRGHSLVFRGDTNEYQADGVKVPSVEELLRRHSELRGLDDGAAVSADEKKRAENAAALREEIGRYEKEGAEGSSGEFRNYLSLKKSRGIKAESAMLPVLIFDEAGKPACAGMVDLSGTVNGVPALIGISLAERMSQGRAALQLNLCRLGLMQSYGKACDKLFVMRLLHGSAELSEVPVLEEAAYALLRECLPSFRAESPVKPEGSGSGAGSAAPGTHAHGAGGWQDAPEQAPEEKAAPAPEPAAGQSGTENAETAEPAEPTEREAECKRKAERLRDVSWFCWFFPVLILHLLILMLFSGAVIGWWAALYLILTFTAGCLIAWPVIASSPVTEAAGNSLFLGVVAIILKGAAWGGSLFFGGMGDWVGSICDFASGTGAFLALAGIVFGITTRGTSAINEDRNGLVASGIAYLLCTPSSVSFLSGLAVG